MIHTDTLFLRESQLIPHPPQEVDWQATALKIASCIPVVGIGCGIGMLLEARRLRQIDPSLAAIADRMECRAVASILGLGILNLLFDQTEKEPQNCFVQAILNHGYAKVEESIRTKQLLPLMDEKMQLFVEALTLPLSSPLFKEKVIHKALHTPNWETLPAIDLASLLLEIENSSQWDALLDIAFLTPEKPTHNTYFHVERMLYFAVCDSKTVQPNLNGISPDLAAIEISKYLKRYNAKQELQDAFDRIAFKFLPDTSTTLSGLKLGGTGRHAVLYDIQEQPDGTFSLTIYNTGQGSLNTNDNKLHVVQFYDIPKSTMESLVKELKSYHNDDTITFNKLLDQISVRLVKIRSVFTHKTQGHGSCSYKCFSKYLHHTLGHTEWMRFKLWLTKELLSEVFYGELNYAVSEEMLRESSEVFQKRKEKLVRKLMSEG